MSAPDQVISRAPAPARYGTADTYNLLNVFTVLLRDNREALRALFGKPHQHFVSERRFWVWALLFEGVPYWVLSAKGKGTCLEAEAVAVSCRRPGVDLRFTAALYDALHRARSPVPSQRGSDD